MSLVVMSFSGSVVRDMADIHEVKGRVKEELTGGNQVVVVMQGMYFADSKLGFLAFDASRQSGNKASTDMSNKEEMDTLLATASQACTALLAMALKGRHGREGKAKTLSGPQTPFITDAQHGDAKLVSLELTKVKRALDDGNVVVVPADQGITDKGRITTFKPTPEIVNRLGLEIGADRCMLYTGKGVQQITPSPN